MAECAFGKIAENKGDKEWAMQLRATHYWAAKRIEELEEENKKLHDKLNSLCVANPDIATSL